MCGAETVEVSTFRGGTSASEDDASQPTRMLTSTGACCATMYLAVRKKMQGDVILPSMHYFLIHPGRDLGLPERLRGYQGETLAHYRRSCAAVSRRSDTNVAGGPACGQARYADRCGYRRAHSAILRPCCRMCRHRGCLMKC